MTINWQEEMDGASRINKQMEETERLHRFRSLLTRYSSVWGFAPPRERFIWLWQQSETQASTNAEVARLT